MDRDLAANSQLSHYRIISKLGAGGMGEVYLAQDTSELGRTVALKILPVEVAIDKDRLHRFIQEARTVSNLNHPGILTVYEFGQTESVSFMATEFVDGVTLRQHVSTKRLKLIEVMDLVIQMVAALNAAHEAGVTHRDLKPENVMVRRDHIVKVLDFGLAKTVTPHAAQAIDSEAGTQVFVQTEPGIVMGTVSYMSPEQSIAKEVDQRTDIWSIGVVLYEMLAGCVPFQGKDIHRQIIAIQDSDPLPLSQHVDGVPERLEEIVFKCLAKEKDERYQSAKDLLIDLRNLRRKLDVDAEIERTVAPNIRSTSDSASRTQSAAGATIPERHDTTSSAEYLVTGIKQHKLVAGLAVLVLSAAVIALVVYLRTNKVDSAINSIAVMPFVNESGNQEVEYLSDGMTETLIKSLSNLPNLNVKPRSSVFRYKGKETSLQTIAKELNVQAILNGRIIERGGQLLLSLELVDVSKDSVIWSERYERKPSDLVSLQNEIARDVSTKLKAKLSGVEETKVTRTGTIDAEAYQAYLKGRYYWNRRTATNLRKAIEQFKIATDKDPNYALAFVGLGDCYAVLAEYAGIPSSETVPQAKAYAQRALSLDSQLAEAHATMGIVSVQSWEWETAEKEYKRAIEINPGYATVYHWYSILLKDLGRNNEAAAAINRAHELDPLSSIISVNLAELYQLQNNHDASIETSQKIIELDPAFPAAYESIGISYVMKGQVDKAISAVEKAAEITQRAGVTLNSLGYVYAIVGKRNEALAVIKELEDKYARREAIGQDIATVYVALGEKDKAFEWLEKDFQARNGKLAATRWYFPFTPLRDDPRYRDMLKRMNLPT
jgi:eukaryotic-like serine/threonine-protein kinase